MVRTHTQRADWRALTIDAAKITQKAIGGGSSARDEAVDRAVEDGLSREVAECLVDGVADEFGEEALAEDYEGTPDQLDRVFEITDGCLFGE